MWCICLIQNFYNLFFEFHCASCLSCIRIDFEIKVSKGLFVFIFYHPNYLFCLTPCFHFCSLLAIISLTVSRDMLEDYYFLYFIVWDFKICWWGIELESRLDFHDLKLLVKSVLVLNFTFWFQIYYYFKYKK